MPDYKEFISSEFSFYECRIIYNNANSNHCPMIKVGFCCTHLNDILNVLYNANYVTLICCVFYDRNGNDISSKTIKNTIKKYSRIILDE